MTDHQENTRLIASFVVFIVLVISVIWWSLALVPKNLKDNSNLVACTDEAMICPDGTAVGRTGPNCQFAPCPSTNSNLSTNLNANISTNSNVNRAAGGCIITGCSGTICSDHPEITDCLARPTDRCYATAQCQRTITGACAWVFTEELQRCLVSGGLPTNSK